MEHLTEWTLFVFVVSFICGYITARYFGGDHLTEE